MMYERRLGGLAVILLLSALAVPARPCSAFLVVGNGRVLMGNNEDFWDHRTLIWFAPQEQDRYGSVFLGYTNRFPQGGMNEAGLAFDGFATAAYPLKEQAGKPAFEGNLIEEAMATCATVEEVVQFFGRYDLSVLQNAMLMFADKSGDSVIIEGDLFLRKQGDFQVVTNFYQSQQEDDRAVCPRFARATSMLEKRGNVSMELCRKTLAAVAQKGGAPTQYSNIFDLEEGRVYLYHFHDFTEEVVYDLARELKRGAHEYEIPALFKPTPAFKAFVASREREIEERITQQLMKDPDRAKLDEYAGRYSLKRPGSTDTILTLRREGDRLLLAVDGQQEQAFLPEAAATFFFIDLEGERKLHFQRGSNGAVSGLVYQSIIGQQIKAARLDQ